MPRNSRIGGETVKSSPTVGSFPVAEPADIQELRVRLTRDGFFANHEAAQLADLERWVVTERPSLEAFGDEVRRRFGPWPRPERDSKGRVIWTRREVDQLAPVIRGAVHGSDKTVMVARGVADAPSAA